MTNFPVASMILVPPGISRLSPTFLICLKTSSTHKLPGKAFFGTGELSLMVIIRLKINALFQNLIAHN